MGNNKKIVVVYDYHQQKYAIISNLLKHYHLLNKYNFHPIAHIIYSFAHLICGRANKAKLIYIMVNSYFSCLGMGELFYSDQEIINLF
jgi:hypothetical protein